MRLGLTSWSRVLTVALALAAWPVWRWYVQRTVDGSDEPYGLLALAALLLVVWRRGGLTEPTRSRWIGAATFLGVYVATFGVLSPLPRALLAVAAFATLYVPARHAVSYSALLGLSLPVVATAQFYLGYPLRILAGGVSVSVLRLLGFVVTQEGTLLHWKGEAIMVDAPCSGVRMLWVGLYLTGCLAAWRGLDNRRALVLFAIAFPLIIAANAIRAAALFFKEARIVVLPDWTHTAIGVAIFAAAALLIMRLARKPEVALCAS